MDDSASFSALRGHHYVSLTTFRKTGRPVSTPVWFAGDDHVLYVWTNARSGKVKRLRNNPAVTLAPCTYNGRVLGPEQKAVALLLPESSPEAETADRTLRAKYGWQWRLGRFISRTFGRESVFLKVEPA